MKLIKEQIYHDESATDKQMVSTQELKWNSVH